MARGRKRYENRKKVKREPGDFYSAAGAQGTLRYLILTGESSEGITIEARIYRRGPQVFWEITGLMGEACDDYLTAKQNLENYLQRQYRGASINELGTGEQ
jgi:hypothetical protein